MYTLAIVNQKGGVGKTTTAVTLAHGLTLKTWGDDQLQILLVDLDAQGNVADALGLEKRPGLYDLLVSRDPDAAVAYGGRSGLACILSDKRTVETKQILAGRNFREYSLQKALEHFADEGWYDVVILDAAPGVDVLQVGALVACDGFLIPVALDHLAVVGAGDALASAAALSGHGLGGEFLGVLPTMWERSTKESDTQLKELVGQFKRLVWPPIPKDVKAREAPAFGRTLYEYAEGCRALAGIELKNGERAGGYNQVVERLMGVIDG
jgi:chromosome partitioning protein